MTLKIEPVSVEELEQEFGTSTSGNDPETVQYIRGLAIGQGFAVTAEGGETDRMVKRRINACAKEGFRELDWRTKADGKTLAARVKAIDVETEKKWLEEQAQKAPQEPQEKAPETPTPNGTPAPQETPPETQEKAQGRRQPAAAGA